MALYFLSYYCLSVLPHYNDLMKLSAALESGHWQKRMWHWSRPESCTLTSAGTNISWTTVFLKMILFWKYQVNIHLFIHLVLLFIRQNRGSICWFCPVCYVSVSAYVWDILASFDFEETRYWSLQFPANLLCSQHTREQIICNLVLLNCNPHF